MNCEIAKDLMTLYVEGMCSEESAKELEKHLKECESCSQMYEQLKAELKGGESAVKADYTEENKEALKPMKKVKKSLFRRKLLAVVLGLILVVLLVIVGILSYGQMTNRVISFSAIADAIHVKNVCEDLAEGDTQALLDVVAFRLEDRYQIGAQSDSLNAGFEEYKKQIKASMDEAYAYYFEGRDIKVKITEIGLVPYEESLGDNIEDTAIAVGFFEGDDQIYEMTFCKVVHQKYSVYETIGNSKKPAFAANLLPYDDTLLEICLRHSTRKQYAGLQAGDEVRSYAPGLCLLIEKSVADQENYKDEIKARLEKLYISDWYIKDVLYAPDYFDAEQRRWIYKTWFQVENQKDGSVIVMEQHFAYFDQNFYVLEREEPVIMATQGEASQEVQDFLLTLFR